MAAKGRNQAKASRHYQNQRGYDRYGGYSSSSNAYQLNPKIQEEEKRRKQKKTKSGIQFVFSTDEYAKVAKEIYILGAVIFIGCLGLLFSGARIESKKMEVAGLQGKVKTIERANQALEAEIYENYDEKEIERIATERLGMSKPKPYKMIHISVPKSRNITRYENIELAKKENATWISKIIQRFRS